MLWRLNQESVLIYEVQIVNSHLFLVVGAGDWNGWQGRVSVVQVLLVCLAQVGHLGVPRDPDAALHRHVAAILLHTVHIVVEAAE